MPSVRSQGLAADYGRLLERLKIEESHILRQAQLRGVKITQPTLSRLRTAALEKGTGDETLRAIARVLDEPPEQAFPSVFASGDAVRDRILILLPKLSPADQASVLSKIETMASEAQRRHVDVQTLEDETDAMEGLAPAQVGPRGRPSPGGKKR